MPSTKCLIFESDVTGHRLQHVHHLAYALLAVGCEVAVALQTDAREHDEFRVHLAPIESDFQLLAQLDSRQQKDFFSVSRRVDELVDAIGLVKPDWVYVPYADTLTQVAAARCILRGRRWLRHVPIEGQVMRGRYAYPSRGLKQRLGSATTRWLTQRSPWRVTHLLDTLVYNNLQGTSRTTEYRLIPEPVERLPDINRAEARRALGVPVDGRYVATVGGMDPRKGIDLLLAAFARARLRADDRLLLVGKMNQPMRELVARDYGRLGAAGRLQMVDRYVSDFELGCGFLAGDVLVTPHPQQVGSSGTMVRAAAAGRPVIASDYGWVGWVTEKFSLGKSVNVRDLDAFAAAIETALERPPEARGSEAADRFRRYHTVENQKAHWLVSLGRERGVDLGEFATRVEWPWVLEAAR